MDQKKTEKLMETEMKIILDSIQSGIVIIDAETNRIIEVNPIAVKMIGAPEEKIIGAICHKYICPAEKGKCPITDLGQKVDNSERVLLRANGGKVSILKTVTIIVLRGRKCLLENFIDITERKETEKKLKESEERFKSMFEQSADAILLANPKTRKIIDCNKATEKLLGYSKEEILSMYADQLHPRDLAKETMEKGFKKQLTGEIKTIESEILTKDKRRIPVSIGASLIKIGGKPYMQGIFRDITKRKEAEEKLRETNNYLQNLIVYANAPIIVWDPHFRITQFNQAFESLTGRKASDVIGKSLELLFPPAMAENTMKFIRKTLTGERLEVIEISIQHIDGSVRTVLWNSATIFAPDGKTAVAIIAQGQDITERKKTEQSLRESEEKHKILLENLPQKIFFKDRNSVYVSCNENYARDLKIKPEEIAGKTDYEFYPKKLAEKYRGDDKRLMEAGKTEDIEEDYIQDGQKVFVHTVKTPVKDEKGNIVGILGIFWDITEEKEMEKQRFESNKRLQRLAQKLTIARDELKVAIETKGEFMNIAAHELRTPLQPIIGYADRLLQESNPTDWQKERLNIILDNAKRLLKLIQDLLDINKMETGIMKFAIAEVDLLAIIKEIHQSFKPVVEAKKLKFILDISETPGPIKVEGDPNKLNQVFSNLLDNAIKFTDKGGITIQVKEGKNTATVSFKDTGSGIAKKYMPQLFTKFFQADATDKRKASGTGLGLAICKEIVKAHKGKISAQSTQGKGSTFQVILPKLTRPTKRKGVENGQNFGSRR